jgi:hypothetical protein
MEHFKAGEVVARCESPNAMRGNVVRVTDDGYFVTVQWSDRVGPQGWERHPTVRRTSCGRLTD